MNCRHCKSKLDRVVIDLATSPPSNAYLTAGALAAPETYYPLKVFVCESCWLTQLQDFAASEDLFTPEYAYFSSVSTTWLKHSEAYVEAMISRFGLGADSCVVEVAANDGYLLQYVLAQDIPCYGIEPTASTAAAARDKGIEIVESFFGEELGSSLAGQGRQADLTAANNVLAHVPDINDFLRGFARILKPHGVATFEFPHLLSLIQGAQFDTIYHEHYSYLSLTALERIFPANGLALFDVEELPTHGGSLRCFVQRSDTGNWSRKDAVSELLERERAAGVGTSSFYENFQAKADSIKDDFLSYLMECKRSGLKVAAYGAAAKGNTLINYAGVRADMINYVVDNNPQKQGQFLPGSRIPIVSEEALIADRPDRVVILPWNLADELTGRLSFISEWGGRCVTFVPGVREIEP